MLKYSALCLASAACVSASTPQLPHSCRKDACAKLDGFGKQVECIAENVNRVSQWCARALLYEEVLLAKPASRPKENISKEILEVLRDIRDELRPKEECECEEEEHEKHESKHHSKKNDDDASVHDHHHHHHHGFKHHHKCECKKSHHKKHASAEFPHSPKSQNSPKAASSELKKSFGSASSEVKKVIN